MTTKAQRQKKSVDGRKTCLGKLEPLGRGNASSLDAVLGHQFAVLDDGFVRVIDYLGNDEAIVQAARISYGTGTKTSRTDRALIRYLMRHAHTTPFEMCEIKLHVRVPMDTWRQWIRHRTASVNEYSTRYSIAIDAAQRTEATGWRSQSPDNKQGSDGHLATDIGQALSTEELEIQTRAREVYERRLKLGVAREQARKDLPLSTYTEAIWKIDLHNLLSFLALRMRVNAQQEIRAYAKVIGSEIVARWVPVAWEAFSDYRLDGVVLSRAEGEIVSLIACGNLSDAAVLARQQGLVLGKVAGAVEVSGEGRELEQKLQALKLTIPWR